MRRIILLAVMLLFTNIASADGNGYTMNSYGTWTVLDTEINTMYMEAQSGSKKNLIECRMGEWIAGGNFNGIFRNSIDDETITLVIDGYQYAIPKTPSEKESMWKLISSERTQYIAFHSKVYGKTPAIPLNGLTQYLQGQDFYKSNCYVTREMRDNQ